MAITQFIYLPNRVIDSNGIADGASIYFYRTGTTTPQTIYADAARTTPLENPVVVAAGAAVPNIYLDPAYTYRVKVETANGVVSDKDPYRGIFEDVGAFGETLVNAATASDALEDLWLDKVSLPIEQFGGGTDVVDNTSAFTSAFSELANRGGGTLQLGKGTYNLASATLGGTGLTPPSNCRVKGAGKHLTTITITGTTQCYLFVNETCKSNQLFEDMTLRGNSTAIGSGPGGAYYCSVLTGTATSDVQNVVFRNLRLENFKGDFWIRFYVTDATYAIRNCGLDWGCEAQSYTGNCRDPNDLGVNSSVVEFNTGASGYIYDAFVRGLWADLNHIKTGVIFYSNCVRPRVISPTLLNAFRAHAISDKGGYAIQIYDASGVVTDAVIENAIIANPYSCGFYVAGSNRTKIINPVVSGQTDTASGTLPKAAISLNGAVNFKVQNPDLVGNAHDIYIVGPVENVGSYYYPSDVNGQIIGGSATGASNDSVVIKNSPFHAELSGIRFIGFRTKGGSARGVMIQGNATQGFGGLEFINCDIEGTNYAIDINPSAVAGHKAKRIKVTGGRLQADTGMNFRQQTPSTTTSIFIENVEMAGSPGYHVDLTDTKVGVFNNNILSGSSTGINLILDGAQVALSENVDLNNGTLVYGGTASLGRAKPTFSSYFGHYVQNAISGLTGTTPNAYRVKGWICQGGTTWADDVTGLQ